MEKYVCSICGTSTIRPMVIQTMGLNQEPDLKTCQMTGLAQSAVPPKTSLSRNNRRTLNAKKEKTFSSKWEAIILGEQRKITNEGFVTIDENHQVIIFNKAAKKYSAIREES